MNILCPFILFLLTSYTLFSAGESEQTLNLEGFRAYYGDTVILAGISFPPFANGKQIDFTLEKLDKLAQDRIRIAIDWRNREPEKGRFYWEPMDRRMEAAREAGISVFLTVHSLAPDWARLPDGEDGACLINEEALKAYIEAILLRYDNIDKIQFGNEWESETQDGTVYFARKSIEKFVIYNNILYDAVKRLDKLKADYDAKGVKGNVEYVLARARFDMIDIHLYDDPENWADYLAVLPRDRPILVSEFGGPNSEIENTAPEYQAERMDAYIDGIESLPAG